MELQKTTVRLPKKLIKSAKKRALEQGVTLQALIITSLTQSVLGHQRDTATQVTKSPFFGMYKNRKDWKSQETTKISAKLRKDAWDGR